MEYVDFYEVLGVSKDAGTDELKKKYRQLARKYHPDVSKEPDAEERFKQINEAYDVLKDKDKRAAYDQMGADWKHGQDFNAPPGFDFGDGGGSFGDIFETLFSQGGFSGGGFGGQQGGGFASKGADLQTSVRVDLIQVLRGEEVNITVNGKNLNVKIPKGIKAGQKIRLAGQGQAGMGGGPSGDLLVEVSINKHPLYSIDGKNLVLELAIAPWEAALGTKVNVPMPEGKKIQLTVPADSQSGTKMRIPKKGLPGNPAGDLHVMLKIEAPLAETDEQRDYYEKMSQLFEFNGRDKLSQ